MCKVAIATVPMLATQVNTISRYQSTGTSNAVAQTYHAYDGLGRLTDLDHKQSTTVLAGYDYVYDAASRITSINSTVEGLSTFTYDVTNQLTGADHASPRADESYSYDSNGNRTMTGYVVGSNNLTTSDGTYSYLYDNEGNMVKKTTISTGAYEEYAWDYRNRLTNVTFKNSSHAVLKTVDHAYDAYNRWLRRTYDSDGPGPNAAVDQFFAYDGYNPVLEFSGPSDTNLSHRYLWGPAVDQILADEQVTSLSSAGNILWALSDHLGTPRDLADLNESTGITSVTNHRTYNSFGLRTAETNAAVDFLFGFTGKAFDEVTGLQNNVNRLYDAVLGQWRTEDPIGFGAHDANLRRYVTNSPATYTDPSGLAPPQRPGAESTATPLPIPLPITLVPIELRNNPTRELALIQAWDSGSFLDGSLKPLPSSLVLIFVDADGRYVRVPYNVFLLSASPDSKAYISAMLTRELLFKGKTLRAIKGQVMFVSRSECGDFTISVKRYVSSNTYRPSLGTYTGDALALGPSIGFLQAGSKWPAVKLAAALAYTTSDGKTYYVNEYSDVNTDLYYKQWVMYSEYSRRYTGAYGSQYRDIPFFVTDFLPGESRRRSKVGLGGSYGAALDIPGQTFGRPRAAKGMTFEYIVAAYGFDPAKNARAGAWLGFTRFGYKIVDANLSYEVFVPQMPLNVRGQNVFYSYIEAPLEFREAVEKFYAEGCGKTYRPFAPRFPDDTLGEIKNP